MQIADGQCDDRDVAAGGRTNAGLRQFPLGVLQLRLDLRDGSVDTADLGIHGELGTLLRCFGRAKLRRHRLELNLGILLLELGVCHVYLPDVRQVALCKIGAANISLQTAAYISPSARFCIVGAVWLFHSCRQA